VGEEILGIKIVDRVNILGITIDRRLAELDTNWDTAILKMRRHCGFWGNFGLGVSGRVMAVKTYIMSQVIYMMGVLPLSDEKANEINEIMVQFVKGRDRVLEGRRTLLLPELGGYGIINVKHLNVSIKSAWIKRWKKEVNFVDYPRVVVLGEVNDNVERIEMRRVERLHMVVLEDIVRCWLIFKDLYYQCGTNIENALLFENNTLYEGEAHGIEQTVFGRGRYDGIRGRIRGMRVNDLYDIEKRPRSRVHLNNMWGVDINWAEYFRLRDEGNRIKTKYADTVDKVAGVDLDVFLQESKKGSKKFRLIMMGRRSKEYRDFDPKGIASARTFWGGYLDGMSRLRVELNFGIWKISILEANFKEFLFKLLQGRLYLN
jgi:hypothetical protein